MGRFYGRYCQDCAVQHRSEYQELEQLRRWQNNVVAYIRELDKKVASLQAKLDMFNAEILGVVEEEVKVGEYERV